MKIPMRQKLFVKLSQLSKTVIKIFIVVGVFFTIINLFIILGRDDSPSQKNLYEAQTKKEQLVYYEQLGRMEKSNNGKIAAAVYRRLLCSSIGETCTDNPEDAKKNYADSFFGRMTSYIVAPYASPPSSGVYFVYDRLPHAGFVPQAYAAEGIGFASIKGYGKIWNLFRNISYALMVIII